MVSATPCEYRGQIKKEMHRERVEEECKWHFVFIFHVWTKRHVETATTSGKEIKNSLKVN